MALSEAKIEDLRYEAMLEAEAEAAEAAEDDGVDEAEAMARREAERAVWGR